MNKSKEYLLKAHFYWEKAEQSAVSLERDCWLMIANGYLQLHQNSRAHEPAKPLSVQLQPRAAQSAAAPNKLQPQGDPASVDFCQFSLVDREFGSHSRSTPREPPASPPPRRRLSALIWRH
jgi:hypothetical protein